MSSYNQVHLMGNLTRSPDLKYLPSQMAVASFGVACNRKFKAANGESRDEVTFVDCTAWGKTAELVAKYYTKGKPIFVVGRLKTESWEKDGQKRSKLALVVEQLIFLPRNDGNNAGESPASDDQGEPEPVQRPAVAWHPPTSAPRPAEQPFGEEQQFKDDDIPFAHNLPARWI